MGMGSRLAEHMDEVERYWGRDYNDLTPEEILEWHENQRKLRETRENQGNQNEHSDTNIRRTRIRKINEPAESQS